MCYQKMPKLDLRYCEDTKEEVLECEGVGRKEWLYGKNHSSVGIWAVVSLTGKFEEAMPGLGIEIWNYYAHSGRCTCSVELEWDKSEAVDEARQGHRAQNPERIIGSFL